MSTAAGTPSNGTQGASSPDRPSKGKGKHPAASPDVSMEDEEVDEDEDEDEDEEMDEDDEEDDAEDPDIDPSAILTGGRRTRGIKVDYTSEEALKKAGLKPEDEDDEDDEVKHKDD